MRTLFLFLLLLVTVPVIADDNSRSGPEIVCPAVLESNRNALLKKYEHLPEEERLEAFEKDHMLFGLWQPYIRQCVVVDLVSQLNDVTTDREPVKIMKVSLDFMVRNNEISGYTFSDDMTYAILEL